MNGKEILKVSKVGINEVTWAYLGQNFYISHLKRQYFREILLIKFTWLNRNACIHYSNRTNQIAILGDNWIANKDGALSCKDKIEVKNHVKYVYLGVEKNNVWKLK